ncbi:double homeobox protein 4C-like [Cervus canadensis]|uniref:double homeobox protein 4C-like n=1 Tax=Cervus canadensis TaxID=1574408 RepID=UPI001CA33E0E|nr:double homeobox protein 4C-like [Cervus canadensis]
MASSSSSSTSGGPIARGSRRRRLVLKLSQKDTLQALFQQNPYPGIATRERLARELGIAESRVQVWFQNQRRRWLKQSRSPSANMHQDGEGAPRSTARPPSTPPRPQSSTQVPVGNFSLRPPRQPWPRSMLQGTLRQDRRNKETHRGMHVCRVCVQDSAREARRKRTVISPSQTRILVQAFTRDRFPGIAAREELARQTGIPEARIQVRSPPSAWAQAVAQETGTFSPAKPLELDTHMVSKPKSSAPPAERKGACKASAQDQGAHRHTESMPPLAASRSFWAPTFWVPVTASASVWATVDVLLIQPSPVLSSQMKKATTPPTAVPWAPCSPADTAPWQPGPGAILPPLQPETHIRRAPESPVGEGTAPPLEPQPHPPSLPSSTNLLDEVLAATGILEMQAPSAGAAADAGAHPALPGAPSFLEEFWRHGIPEPSQAPSLAPLQSRMHSLPCQTHPAF